MEWRVPFVVFRPDSTGNFEEIFQTADFKKAKYWLTYIAEVGDVLCRTPNHPKYAGGDGLPEYVSHKIAAGKLDNDLNKLQARLGNTPVFPGVAARAPESYDV
jgi:hypothetical protein